MTNRGMPLWMCWLYDGLQWLNPSWPQRFDDWAERHYQAACGTWRWRFWFEVTGQGWAGRRYYRAVCRRQLSRRRGALAGNAIRLDPGCAVVPPAVLDAYGSETLKRLADGADVLSAEEVLDAYDNPDEEGR